MGSDDLSVRASFLLLADSDGRALFAGPRVRMGLHWAREGTVAMRFHNLTRHKVFAGPAIQITMDVSEAANGGQILLTEVRQVFSLLESLALPYCLLAHQANVRCVAACRTLC